MNPCRWGETDAFEEPIEYEEVAGSAEPDGPHDSDYLFIAAEEDFDRAIPLILAALRNRRSRDCRESAVWLLECYADTKFAPHILRALKREVRCREKAASYLYVSCLLSFGESLLKPLLAIWKDRDSDSHSRGVAKDFLSHFLSRPLV